jgi:transposase InsO family protein
VTGDRRDSARGAGWEFAHVTIDDHSRASFVQMYRDERKGSAVNFLKAMVAHYRALGVTVKRLLTDNGSAYRSKLFARTCQALGIKHTFTKPYSPKDNGKAERFIQTCLREWAYGRIWANSAERTAWLPAFLAYYNARRSHSALGYKPPAYRLGGNNLLQLNTSVAVRLGQRNSLIGMAALRAMTLQGPTGPDQRTGAAFCCHPSLGVASCIRVWHPC